MPRLVLVALLIAGCGGATPAPTPTPNPASDPGYITRAEYGADWPFTVAAGTLHCSEGAASEAGRLYVTFSHAGEPGVEYAINGSARDFGWPELDETILTDFPNRAKTLPLIERGLALCE